jgi:hypothetical protein
MTQDIWGFVPPSLGPGIRNCFRFLLIVIASLLGGVPWSGCGRRQETAEPNGPYSGADPIHAEVDSWRYKVRDYYNSSNFAALESTMKEIRAGDPFFKNGSWKIYQFYQCLRCRDSEVESMWQLHDRIHQAWEKAYPQSIAARIAHADFFTSYAWQARGSGWSNSVGKEGWRLFEQRLATAQQILDQAKPLQPADPMWWNVEMTVALGQGWDQARYAKMLREAQQAAPQFWHYNLQLSKYLLPRWYGRPGDWEKAAAADIKRSGGLGLETYARTVANMRGYYDNIFRETKASWPDTKAGFEVMRQKYPDSLEILSAYCCLACQADDRALAKQLFQQLNGFFDQEIWGSSSFFQKCHDWALSGT